MKTITCLLFVLISVFLNGCAMSQYYMQEISNRYHHPEEKTNQVKLDANKSLSR